MRLAVAVVGQRSGAERLAVAIDISLAGVGVECEEPLVPGERVSVAFTTPTLWDPLVLDAIVAWSHPPRVTDELDALGRPRTAARAGIAFDYATPDSVLAVFEMLGALGFE